MSDGIKSSHNTWPSVISFEFDCHAANMLCFVDFEQFLVEDPAIPFDVKLEVYEDEESTNCLGSVNAHKIFLASVSRVFRNIFFGPFATTSGCLRVSSSSVKAVAMFVKIIYGNGQKNCGFLLNLDLDLAVGLEIINLIDFFQVDGNMMDRVLYLVRNKLMCGHADVETLLEWSPRIFHNISLTRSLLKIVGDVMTNTDTQPSQVFKVLESRGVPESLLKKVRETFCSNCQQFRSKIPCKNEQRVAFTPERPLLPGQLVQFCRWMPGQDVERSPTLKVDSVTIPAQLPLDPSSCDVIEGGMVNLATLTNKKENNCKRVEVEVKLSYPLVVGHAWSSQVLGQTNHFTLSADNLYYACSSMELAKNNLEKGD